jgi:hypothetical protein
MPLVALVLGVWFSSMFWLVFVPWRDRSADAKAGGDKAGRDKTASDKRDGTSLIALCN